MSCQPPELRVVEFPAFNLELEELEMEFQLLLVPTPRSRPGISSKVFSVKNFLRREAGKSFESWSKNTTEARADTVKSSHKQTGGSSDK